MRLTCKKLLSCSALFLLFLLFQPHHSFAQVTKNYNGVVTDSKGTPVDGASVAVKGTTQGVKTDRDGKFSITAAENAIVVITSVGFKTVEIQLTGGGLITIEMEQAQGALNEVVVVGYGTQRRKDLTGSISTVEPKAIGRIATNDVLKAIQGQVAGVSVTGSGQPGAVPSIKIRGIGTFNNNNPLYIVDGVQTPVNDLVISDIESVQILKDGSAAAIYGSRAANGVIIITTKRGRTGQLRLDYKGYYGVQSITQRYDVANTKEYQMLVNEASVNAGLALKPANDASSPFFVSNINTDWQEEVFKTGKLQEHTIGLSGGTDAAKYFVSFNYFDHAGTIEGKGPDYKRYSVRVNTDFKQGRFKFGESIAYSKINQRFLSFLHNSSVLSYTVSAIPTLPVFDATTRDGYSSSSQTVHGSYTANPIGFNNVLDSKTERFRFIGNVYGELELARPLKYRLNLGYERIDWNDFYFQPIHDLGWFYVNNIAKLNDWRGSGNTGTIEHTLSYDKIFDRHTLSVVVGNSVLQSNVNRLFGHGEGFRQPYFPVLGNDTIGTNRSILNDVTKSRLISYFGRVNYAFNDKYLLTATIRRDGSSRFAPSYRWGNFPSIALGWKLHSEKFMEEMLPSSVTQLKLRASYGELGNQEIGDYQYQAYINSYAHAVFGNQIGIGATQTQFAVPDIRWEAKVSKNIGLDLTLLNKLNFTVEYYNNVSKDILLRVQIPGSTGVYPWESPFINAGSIRNSGFEFQVGFNDSKGDFSYSFNANASTLKNEVLSLGYGNNPLFGYGNITKTEVGRSVGELFGLVMDGIFQTQGEIDALNSRSPIGRYQEAGTRPGDIRFKDLNGRDANGLLTGKPDGKVDNDDRTYLGRAIPNFYYGFNANLNYKQFDFAINAAGASGNKIFNTIQAGIENGAGWDNYSKRMLNRWTPTNTSTDIPRVVIADPNGNNRAIERWIENGSFLRITSLQLGYNLAVGKLSHLRLSNARIYVSAQNLLTFTKYTGFDPDFANNDGLLNRAIDNGNYALRPFTSNEAGTLPNPRTFIIGVQVGF